MTAKLLVSKETRTSSAGAEESRPGALDPADLGVAQTLSVGGLEVRVKPNGLGKRIGGMNDDIRSHPLLLLWARAPGTGDGVLQSGYIAV